MEPTQVDSGEVMILTGVEYELDEDGEVVVVLDAEELVCMKGLKLMASWCPVSVKNAIGRQSALRTYEAEHDMMLTPM